MAENACLRCGGTGWEPDAGMSTCTGCHGWRVELTTCAHEWRFCCTYDEDEEGRGCHHETCPKCGAESWDGEVSRGKH